MKNLFNTEDLDPVKQEVFQSLLSCPHCRIERIVTQKPFTVPGEWYDQEEDEWVVLLEGSATLEFSDGTMVEMKKGDYIFIPARKVHRMAATAHNTPCIWLAVHGKLQ